MSNTPPIDSRRALDRVIREDWGRILSVLTRGIGDLQLAEDCLQDAVERAMIHWSRDGLPRSPSAWLLTTARRRALDRFRRDANLARKLPDFTYLQELDAMESDDEPGAIPDKRLEMVFTCCHPSLDEKSRVALTLRTLGGLKTEEIAAAFLDKPATMGQRLSRAKTKIAKAGIPYRVPDAADLPERLSAVMQVIYLVFNEGYRASSGSDFMRLDLCAEAVRLGRIMVGLVPDDAELRGLLALMLLNHARAGARHGEDGSFVPLDAQNRARWDRAAIAEGVDLLADLSLTGPYQLQAAISACHGRAPDWGATDWHQIAGHYAHLQQVAPNPVVQINWAVALIYAGALAGARELLNSVENVPGMDQYQPFFVARAELYQRLGEVARAGADLRRAIELVGSAQEATFLERKLAELDGSGAG